MPAEKKCNHLIWSFRIIVLLVLLVVLLSGVMIWMVKHPQWAVPLGAGKTISEYRNNIIQGDYPETDFTKVYPDLSPADIDLLQRDSYRLRMVYEPFVEFRVAPTKTKFIEVTDAGFRKGLTYQPWPPSKRDRVVFVFGGSTTFGYDVKNEDALPCAIQNQLNSLYPRQSVQCYNFGCGYYFSSQERILFETLLVKGFVPDLAIFVDGVNDFFYPNGNPQLSGRLAVLLAPDLPPRPPQPEFKGRENVSLAEQVLNRYLQNLRMTTAVAEKYGVPVIFVAQPVPFMHFPMNPETFPFTHIGISGELIQWGYPMFEQWSQTGKFGEKFIWCGDALASATGITFVDGLHYSRQGGELLARCVVGRAREKNLLPWPLNSEKPPTPQ